jgi:choice-of-anchor B domain-containing protein
MKYALFILLLLFGTEAFSQARLNMDSLFNWRDVSLPASTAHSNTYNEVWGYAKGGREYAIIGSTMGTHIFDVTVPANSVQVEFIEGAFTGPNVIHRHFHDHDDYLYMVCDEGTSTLQIADLRFLPDSAPVVYDSDELFPRAHNIFIDTSSARMYVCGGTVQYSVYSLANPTVPTLLSNCPVDVPFWSSIGYIHDTYVRNDTAYVNAENRGLFIVDFTDVSDPQMIGSLDVYPQQGYNHSGWLNPNAPYYAMADETHGKDVKIIDVSDMSDLVLTDTISTNVSEFSIPHNLVFRGDHLFISYYFDGVYMFNCQDPAHPVLAGFYDTSNEPHQDGFYRGCWGVYPLLPSGNILASDMQTGLWVLGTNLPNGVSENDAKDGLGIYPNPTNGPLNFNVFDPNSIFSIFDLTGREVRTGAANGSINVAELKPGPYVLQISSDEKISRSRFLKR